MLSVQKVTIVHVRVSDTFGDHEVPETLDSPEPDDLSDSGLIDTVECEGGIQTKYDPAIVYIQRSRRCSRRPQFRELFQALATRRQLRPGAPPSVPTDYSQQYVFLTIHCETTTSVFNGS